MSDDDDSPPAPSLRATSSDSDVRLMVTDDVRKQLTGSSSDMPVFQPGGPKSDSDVRLVGPGAAKKGSDSDVKLIKPKDSDSDVKLSESDSDVRLAAGSGSGVKLSDSDSDVRLALPMDSDSDVKLLGSPAADMGDSVLLDDEGPLALPSDSSIRGRGDSGLGLRGPADSGILLESPADSGINLLDDDAPLSLLDSGIKKQKSSPKLAPSSPAPTMADDDLDMTAPMLLREDDEESRTDPEVPLLLEDEEEEHDLMPKNFLGGAETEAETSVVMFDEDEDAGPPSKKRRTTEADEAAFDLEGAADEEEVEELEVSDEVLGEDDEIEDLEVFEEEGADEEFESGVSAADFPIAGGRMAVPAEPEWSTGAVVLTMASSLLMVLGAWMAADLLGTVSAAGTPVAEGPFVGFFGGLFK
jgi:hypothetical protein